MKYEQTYNSIREQQYRLGIVKRTPKTTVTKTKALDILYSTLLIVVLVVLPSIASI